MKTVAGLPYSLSTKHSSPAWLPVVGTFVAIILITLLVLAQMVPPATVPASAPATVFSADRALDHLQTIARAPHPTGSPESVQVRQYLFDQLARLGLQAEIQSTTSVYHDTGKWGLASA